MADEFIENKRQILSNINNELNIKLYKQDEDKFKQIEQLINQSIKFNLLNTNRIKANLTLIYIEINNQIEKLLYIKGQLQMKIDTKYQIISFLIEKISKGVLFLNKFIENQITLAITDKSEFIDLPQNKKITYEKNDLIFNKTFNSYVNKNEVNNISIRIQEFNIQFIFKGIDTNETKISLLYDDFKHLLTKEKYIEFNNIIKLYNKNSKSYAQIIPLKTSISKDDEFNENVSRNYQIINILTHFKADIFYVINDDANLFKDLIAEDDYINSCFSDDTISVDSLKKRLLNLKVKYIETGLKADCENLVSSDQVQSLNLNIKP